MNKMQNGGGGGGWSIASATEPVEVSTGASREAALRARIEVLEAALRELADGYGCCPVSRTMSRMAIAALGEKKDGEAV
jgi:hypothetical protein